MVKFGKANLVFDFSSYASKQTDRQTYSSQHLAPCQGKLTAVLTEGSVVLPQLQLGEHESGVTWKPLMNVGHAQLTQLTARHRRP